MPISDADNDIKTELAELARSPIKRLRERWRTIFRSKPPPAFGPDLLRRGIAQKIQEQHYGGLSAIAKRQLDEAIKAVAANPTGRVELPRRIMPGAVLVRSWKDKSHHVTILADGFSYEGRSYRSLSEIAREITGARWNGPRFFGLRIKTSNKAGPLTTSAERHHGRDADTSVDLFGSITEARQ